MSEVKKRQVFIQLDDDDDEDDQLSQNEHHPFAPQSSMNDQEENFKMTSNMSYRDYSGFNETLEGREDNLRSKVEIIDQEAVEFVREQHHPQDESETQYQTHFQNIDPLQYSSNRSSKNPSQSSSASQRASISSELEAYKAQLASNNTNQNNHMSGGQGGAVGNQNQQEGSQSETPRINRSNIELTPEVSQLQFSQNQNQDEQNFQDQTGFQTMDYQAQDQELMERIIQQVLERQDNIVYAIGEESQFPLMEQSNVNNFQELCSEINNQMQFLFDYYEDLRKSNAQKFNSTNTQRQLIREKENLNTLLKQSTDENKDLQVRIKQYNSEIEDLQKRINQMNLESIERQSIIFKQSASSQSQSNNQGRPSLQGGQSVNAVSNQAQNPRTPKHVIKQFIDLDGSPAEEIKQENASAEKIEESGDDKIAKLTEIIKQLEKQNQELKESKEKESSVNKSISGDSQSSSAKTLIRQKSRENFKSKYYQLSLSNIEESDHESSFTTRQQSQLIAQQDFIWSRKIEEKDLTIQSLQDRIRMLMQASQIHVNIMNSEPTALNTIGQLAQQSNNNPVTIFDNSLAPSRSGSFTLTPQNALQGNMMQAASSQNQPDILTPTSQHGVRSKPSLRFLPNQQSQIDSSSLQSNRDLLERNISQAKTIEEILINKSSKNSNNQLNFNHKISRKGSLSSVSGEQMDNKEKKREKVRKQESQAQIKSDINELENKVEEVNKRYFELLREHKSLLKEKNILLKLMEDVTQANQNLDADFKVLFKQMKQMSEKQRENTQSIVLAPITGSKERNSYLSLADYLIPKQETNASLSLINAQSQATIGNNKHQHSRYLSEIQINDMDALVEYIDTLFREKDYIKAGSLWQKLHYDELAGIKLETQQEYLKILMVIKDNQLQDEGESPQKRISRELTSYKGPYNIKSSSSFSRSRSRSPEKQTFPKLDIPQPAQNLKLNQLIDNHMRNRQQKLTNLEQENSKLVSKISKLEDQLAQTRTKYELVQGERDSQKRKNERLKQDMDKMKDEHQKFKQESERQKLEMQERHEKLIGKLKQESRRESGITFGGGQVASNKTQSQFEDYDSKRFRTQGDEEEEEEDDDIGKRIFSKKSRESIESTLQYKSKEPSKRDKINSRRTSDNRFDGISNTARMSNMSFKAPSSQVVSKFNQISREESEAASSPQLNPHLQGKDKLQGDKEIEETLRKLYSQFFTSEYKHTQDKIRNKNSIFKELFEVTFNEIEAMSAQIRDLKRTLRKSQAENIEVRQQNTELTKIEDVSHSYAIKMIRRFQGDQNLSNEHKEDLKSLTLIQLLKQVSSIVSEIEKNYKKLQSEREGIPHKNQEQKLRELKTKKQSEKLLQMSQEAETYEDFIQQLTKEEVIDMLKELQEENDKLRKKLQTYKYELSKLKEEIAQQKQLNEEIELENTKLKRYCRNLRPQQERNSKDASNYNSNHTTQKHNASNQQAHKINSQNQSQNLSDNGTPLSFAKQTSLQQQQSSINQNIQQNAVLKEQIRNFDSKTSVEQTIDQRMSNQQTNNSVVCSEESQQIISKEYGLNNQVDKSRALKPPRESNIHLFNSALPKSINPNKKLLDPQQKQGIVVKKAALTQVSQEVIPSAYHRSRASNSFYNIQKEIGNISANQLNVNNYFGCASTQHNTQLNTLNSANMTQMILPQPPSPIIPPQIQQNTSINTTSNIVNTSSIMTNPYYSGPQSMTPTQKVRDYFNSGETVVNERQIVTNKSSYQDLHQEQLVSQQIIKTGLKNEKGKLVISKIPKNIYRTQFQDNYSATPNRKEIDFNKMRSPMTDNQSPKLFTTEIPRSQDLQLQIQKGQNLRNLISGVQNQKQSIQVKYDQEITHQEYGDLSSKNKSQNMALPMTQRIHSAKQPSTNEQVHSDKIQKKIVALRQPNPNALHKTTIVSQNFTSLSHRAMENPPSVNEIRGALPSQQLSYNRTNLDQQRKYM